MTGTWLRGRVSCSYGTRNLARFGCPAPICTDEPLRDPGFRWLGHVGCGEVSGYTTLLRGGAPTA